MRQPSAPRASSRARARMLAASRLPLSMRTAPISGPTTATARRMPSSTSKVSTRYVEPVPSASRCAANAPCSSGWASTKACAVVPPVGMP